MTCQHENGNAQCMFGRIKVKDDGPVVAFTADFNLICVDCGEPFRFGTDMILSDDRLSVKLSVAPGAGHFERDEFDAPGQYQCPVCMFHLSSNFLNSTTGTVSPNVKDHEPCPNGCGPLARLTWREVGESCQRQLIQVSKRLFALENAWPEGLAMPDSNF